MKHELTPEQKAKLSPEHRALLGLDEPEPLTKGEVAAYARLAGVPQASDRLTVDLREGRVEGAEKVGRSWAIPESAMHAWINSHFAPASTTDTETADTGGRTALVVICAVLIPLLLALLLRGCWG